jgi:hypothetical protein
MPVWYLGFFFAKILGIGVFYGGAVRNDSMPNMGIHRVYYFFQPLNRPLKIKVTITHFYNFLLGIYTDILLAFDKHRLVYLKI